MKLVFQVYYEKHHSSAIKIQRLWLLEQTVQIFGEKHHYAAFYDGLKLFMQNHFDISDYQLF
jgi:hypothetical protein